MDRVQQQLLGLCDGLCVKRGNLRCGLSLLCGAFGLRGKIRVIADGVGIALRNGGGNACNARGSGGLRRGREGVRRLGGRTTSAMGSKAFCNLAAQRFGGGGRHKIAGSREGNIAGRFGKRRIEWDGV